MNPTSPQTGGGARGAVLKTLVFTDLVDSTRLLDRLGDTRAAELFERHDRVARDLLAEHGGREIDKSDGFLLLFDRPVDAVRHALAYHSALAEMSRDGGVQLTARVGVHLGEVLLRRAARRTSRAEPRRWRWTAWRSRWASV